MFACTRVFLVAVALIVTPLMVLADDPGAPDTVMIGQLRSYASRATALSARLPFQA